MKNIFYWVTGGVLLTAVVFFIPQQSGSAWPSVFASSVAAFLYVIVFVAVWIKEIESTRKRKFIGGTLTILLFFSAASALMSYEQNVQVKENLATVNTHIESELIKTFIQEPFITTLADYYQTAGSNARLDEAFKNQYDSLITEDNEFTFGSRDENQSIFIYLVKVSPDSIVLIGESSAAESHKQSFKNFSGHTGWYQVRGILTSKGIDYERQN